MVKMKWMKLVISLMLVSILVFMAACGSTSENNEEPVSSSTETEVHSEGTEESNAEDVVTSLSAYVGAGLKEPFEDLRVMYEEKTGITIETDYNSSGAHVSQIITAKKGDIVIPGGMPFIKKLKEEGAIEHVVSPIAYHVPVIVVPLNNPAKINSFDDLSNSKAELIVPEIEGTALGKTLGRILDNSGKRKEIEKQIIVQVETGPKVLATLLLGEGNAAITEYAAWSKHQDQLKLIEINHEINEVDELPIAVLSFSKKKKAAADFQNFIMEQGPAIFEKHGFKVEILN